MSEVTPVEGTPAEPQTPEPQVNEVELQAQELGWKPEEDFKADPKNEGKKWRPAEEFMDRKSLFDKIDSYHRKVKDLEKGIGALSEHNKKIEKTAYERALRELKQEKRAALEEGDLVKADELNERIDEIKQEVKNVPAPVAEPRNPAFDVWVTKNQWYNENKKMRAFADGYAQQLVADGITNPAEIFAEVEKEVKDTFPVTFRNPRKDTAPSLDTSDRKVSTKKSAVDQLTPEERNIMKTMLRAGAGISEEEYANQVLKSR